MANFDIIEYQKRVINDLTAENKALKEQIDTLNNQHIKIQYHNEELTIREICKRLEKIENEKKTAINDLRVCSIEGFMQCQYCLYKTAKSFCWNCVDGSDWKYRGERED